MQGRLILSVLPGVLSIQLKIPVWVFGISTGWMEQSFSIFESNHVLSHISKRQWASWHLYHSIEESALDLAAGNDVLSKPKVVKTPKFEGVTDWGLQSWRAHGSLSIDKFGKRLSQIFGNVSRKLTCSIWFATRIIENFVEWKAPQWQWL